MDSGRQSFGPPIDVETTAQNIVRTLVSSDNDGDFTDTGWLILEGVKAVAPIGPVFIDILSRAHEIASVDAPDQVRELLASELTFFQSLGTSTTDNAH